MSPVNNPSKMISKEALDKTPLKAMGINTKYLEKGTSAAGKMDTKLKKQMKDLGVDDGDDDEDNDEKKDDKKEEEEDDDDD